MKGFIAPTKMVQISLKTGQTLNCEMWADEFDMFNDLWIANTERPEVISMSSIGGDTLSVESSNIAFVYSDTTEEDTYEQNELEDAFYDDFDDW